MATDVCENCGGELHIYHRNEYCGVAGALHFDAPPAHLTHCNIEGCMVINCVPCGCAVV